jgi:hypothetical protein
MEPDRLRQERPAARVIAQQYSFAAFVSLRFQKKMRPVF